MGIDPSFNIYVLISILALSLIPSVDAAIHRIAHDDSRVSYYPSVCNLDCTRVCRDQWWLSCLSDGSASHRTKGNNTSSNFSFQGSSVTWYTRTANDGGKAVVYIDGADPHSLDTNSPVVNEANPLYTKSGLDPTKVHTISVLYDIESFTEQYERFVDVRYFEYDDGGDAATQASSITQVQNSVTSSTTTPPSSANALSSSSPTTTVSRTALNSTASSTSTSSPASLAPVLVTFSNGTVQTVAVSGNSAQVPNPASSTVSTSSIIGVVLGVAAVLCIFALGCFLFGKRQQRRLGTAIDYSRKRSNSITSSGFGSQSRPISLVSRSRTDRGEPVSGTDTFFRNIRTSHFYTLRNPQGRTAQPILYSNASSSKRQLAQYDAPDLPELHDMDGEPIQSFSPPSHSHQTSDVSLEEPHVDTRTDHLPASPASGTRMTLMLRGSLLGEAHAYSMTQDASSHPGDGSSGGTWLPSTPPPQYIR